MLQVVEAAATTEKFQLKSKNLCENKSVAGRKIIVALPVFTLFYLYQVTRSRYHEGKKKQQISANRIFDEWHRTILTED